MANLITDNIDIWAAAQTPRANGGKGNRNGTANKSAYGIKKLRKLILELAVRGKLVAQDQNDEPASVLLEKIAKEKTRLIKEGNVKKQEPSPEIGEDEEPFELPKGWEWARLTDCYDVRDGTHDSPKSQLKGFPLVTSKNLYSGRLDLTNVNFISEEDHLKIIERSRVDKDDILFAMIGSIGNPVIVDTEVDFSIKNVALFKYYSRELSVPQYLKMFLEIAAVDMKENASGGVQSFVSLGKLRAHVIAFPPLAEQCRIIGKVYELMALCDLLEQQQSNGNTAHQTLVETLLTTLATASNQGEFGEAWERIAEHFDTLFTTGHSIDQLKQRILQLAVMGKLVPQDPNDEPASVLLEKIAAEKARLIREGKIKKQEPLPEITDEETPFELPKGWEWTRLGNVSTNIHYGYTASADHGNSGIRLLRITDIQNDSVNWETVPGCEIEEDKANDYLLEKDDILIARTGGTIGKSYLVEDIDVKAVFASYLIRVRGIEGTSAPFTKTYLGSQLYWQQLYENSMGTGQPNVNATALKSLAFPTPPLAEQYRIVAKVDELMALCDILKTRMNDTQTTQIQLADAVVERAVA